MKFKVKLESESPIVLPIHYNHILKGFIFSNLIKEEIPFTFSNIFGLKRINNKKIIFQNGCHFYVSTLKEELNKGLEGTILNLGKNAVRISEITPLEEVVKEPPITVKTLSPVTVFVREENGKTKYFSPSSEEFYRLIEENINEKAKRFFNRELSFVKVKPSEGSVFKKAVIQYRNRFVVEAWKGIFEIEGEREAIETALKLGLGYKNSQGFGMVALAQ